MGQLKLEPHRTPYLTTKHLIFFPSYLSDLLICLRSLQKMAAKGISKITQRSQNQEIQKPTKPTKPPLNHNTTYIPKFIAPLTKSTRVRFGTARPALRSTWRQCSDGGGPARKPSGPAGCLQVAKADRFHLPFGDTPGTLNFCDGLSVISKD